LSKEQIKSVKMETIELILKHARALYEDKTENQQHHLQLLKSLIKVAMDGLEKKDVDNGL